MDINFGEVGLLGGVMGRPSSGRSRGSKRGIFMDDDALQHILEVSRRMTEMRALVPLLNYVMDEGIKLVGAERGFVVLIQPNGELDFRIKRGLVEELEEARDQISLSVLNQVISSGQPLILRDAVNDPNFSAARSVMMLQLRSIMCVPLISRGEIRGAIYVENRTITNRFKQEALPPLALFGNQAAVAIENAAINENLEKAYQALEKLDRTKSDFIQVAAHELRTPLTVLKGYLFILERMLEKERQANSKLGEALDGITTGQERMGEIINLMLDIAKIDSNVLYLSRRPVRLCEMIEPLLAQFEADLKERNLTLTCYDMETLPEVPGDAELLFKVFYHLIINAIKYTPDGGRISVEGRAITREEGRFVEIVISDTGIGIDPADHELIFEKFYQTGEVAFHSSGKTQYKGGGPGLGLVIVRGIILAHGGRIWVESPACDEEHCPGSQFHFWLPLA